MSRAFVFMITALLAVACGYAPSVPSSAPSPRASTRPTDTGSIEPTPAAPQAQLTEYRSTVARDPATTATDGQLATAVASDEHFALNLYQQLANGDGNVFMSPYSISTCLSMVLAGARGDTAIQLANALGVDDPDTWDAGRNRLDQSIGTGFSLPPQPDPSATVQPLVLQTANTMFGQTGYPFQQPFLDTLARDYGSGLQGVDFATQWEAARLAINDWVAVKTNQRILDLLPPGSLDDMTRSVLVNAIYFKANWVRQFSPEATRPAPFHMLDGSTIEAPTMNQNGMKFEFAQGTGWTAAVLPYYGASMLVIVPDEGKFGEIERQLDAEFISEVDSSMSERQLTLSLPKFSTEQSADLVDALNALGVHDLFDQGKADLTGIETVEPLYISHVEHKANISVDEHGTEAAAATAAVAEASSGAQSATLNVDRPFLYLIRDSATNEILFMGRMVDPN
jgi:serpin B